VPTGVATPDPFLLSPFINVKTPDSTLAPISADATPDPLLISPAVISKPNPGTMMTSSIDLFYNCILIDTVLAAGVDSSVIDLINGMQSNLGENLSVNAAKNPNGDLVIAATLKNPEGVSGPTLEVDARGKFVLDSARLAEFIKIFSSSYIQANANKAA
jgi:hypothetical protein